MGAPVAELRIETERLILTPMAMHDLEAYLALHSHPDVIRFLGEVDRELATSRLQADARLWRERGHGLFKITHRDDGRFLGRVGLKYWTQFDETEVGWTLRREDWGRGFATEAGFACAQWGFSELSVPYLTSYIEPHNARSVSVAERLGMTPLRDDVVAGNPGIGGAVDRFRVTIYAISRDAWARRAHAA